MSRVCGVCHASQEDAIVIYNMDQSGGKTLGAKNNDTLLVRSETGKLVRTTRGSLKYFVLCVVPACHNCSISRLGQHPNTGDFAFCDKPDSLGLLPEGAHLLLAPTLRDDKVSRHYRKGECGVEPVTLMPKRTSNLDSGLSKKSTSPNKS